MKPQAASVPRPSAAAAAGFPYLWVNHEHREGFGEDAEPMLVPVTSAVGLCAVFDGLGGAGAETVETITGPRTGAWLASRVARDAVLSRTDLLGITQAGPGPEYPDGGPYVERPPSMPRPDFASEVHRVLRSRLLDEAARTGAGHSRVKSKLIKTLPTTMAVAWFDVDAHELAAVWAGDSRVYLLTPGDGLQQVSTDDLKTGADAMENLIQDSPMSNCLSADTDFVIHERRVPLPADAVVFAATDGCFGYVPTPMHFEWILLSTLNAADSWEDWRGRLLASIEAVTADDATLAGVVLGWQEWEFESCRAAFQPRHVWCQRRVAGYDDLRVRVTTLQQQLETAKTDLVDGGLRLWEEYRVNYERLLRESGRRDVPEDPATTRESGWRGPPESSPPAREDGRRSAPQAATVGQVDPGPDHAEPDAEPEPRHGSAGSPPSGWGGP